MLEEETICGVIDDRGKFISITREELEEVARFIKVKSPLYFRVFGVPDWRLKFTAVCLRSHCCFRSGVEFLSKNWWKIVIA